MDKKELLKIAIKVAIYALGLLATCLGVGTLTSCTATRDVSVSGRSTIVTVDTTVVNHNRYFEYHKVK